MRHRLLTLGLALGLALACAGEAEVDPLDPEQIHDLALDRGSATGTMYGGSWSFDFTLDSCNCPSIEVGGETQDLCVLVQFVSGDLEVTHVDGLLAIAVGPITATGAVETDGTFVVASQYDASTILGPIESLARMDGQFVDNSSHVDGTMAGRLLGELAGDPLDCRWSGSFTADR